METRENTHTLSGVDEPCFVIAAENLHGNENGMSHTQYTETEQKTEEGVLTEQQLPVIEQEEREERIPPLAARPFYAFFKRGFDIVVSIIALVILLLPMLIIGLLVVLTSRGPAIYVSTRIGKNGKTFRFYKFRSMYQDAESRLNELLEKNEIPGGVTFKMKDDPRITRFGKFLRKTSLDELPQLWNILKGDMSLVGPRPCTGREYALYTERDKQRLLVPQGLTGEWQVHGRSNTTFEEMIDMDLDYIQNKRGFWYDIKLIFRTFAVVCSHKGAE